MTSAQRDASVPLLSASGFDTDGTDALDALPAREAVRGENGTPVSPPPSRATVHNAEQGHYSSINGNTRQCYGSTSLFQWFLWIGSVILTTGSIFLGRRVFHGARHHDQNELNLVLSLSQFLASILTEYIVDRPTTLLSCQRPRLDDFHMAMPAILTTMASHLLGTGFVNLPFRFFCVENHTRLLMVAAVSVYMMKRPYRGVQWICLIAISSLEEWDVLVEFSGFRDGWPRDGYTQVMGACWLFLSILLGAVSLVYIECVFKATSTRVSDWGIEVPGHVSMPRRSAQLSFFTSMTWMVPVLIQRVSSPLHPFLYGLTAPSMWLYIVYQTLVWLWILALVKYTDSVYKTLAMTISFLLADVLTRRKGSTLMAIVIALPCIYWFHHSNPYEVAASLGATSDGMHMVEMGTLQPADHNANDSNDTARLGVESLLLSEDVDSTAGVMRQ